MQPLFNLPESFERLSPKGAEKTAVRSVPQSGMALSSPASSPCLCTPWAKARPRPQTGPPDTLTAADLRERARTRRSHGLSTGAPRSYRLEERCVPPAGFSAPRMASREPESPISCGGGAARTRGRLCECTDHLRRRASQCTSSWHAARHVRVSGGPAWGRGRALAHGMQRHGELAGLERAIPLWGTDRTAVLTSGSTPA